MTSSMPALCSASPGASAASASFGRDRLETARACWRRDRRRRSPDRARQLAPRWRSTVLAAAARSELGQLEVTDTMSSRRRDAAAPAASKNSTRFAALARPGRGIARRQRRGADHERMHLAGRPRAAGRRSRRPGARPAPRLQPGRRPQPLPSSQSSGRMPTVRLRAAAATPSRPGGRQLIGGEPSRRATLMTGRPPIDRRAAGRPGTAARLRARRCGRPRSSPRPGHG